MAFIRQLLRNAWNNSEWYVSALVFSMGTTKLQYVKVVN